MIHKPLDFEGFASNYRKKHGTFGLLKLMFSCISFMALAPIVYRIEKFIPKKVTHSMDCWMGSLYKELENKDNDT